MTFSERSPVLIGLVSLALVAGATLFALLAEGGMFRGGYTLTAEFADAAGLRPGDDVLIAGVRAGEVRELSLAGDRVEAVLRVDGHELSENTRARIRLRTLVGRRAVVLEPTGAWSRPLSDGDRIPLARTDVPVDMPEFGDAAEEVLADTEAELLDRFLVALTEITRGQRAQVETLVAGGTRLTGVVAEQEQEVRALLRRLRQVSEALAVREEEIGRTVEELSVALAALAERRSELRRLARSTNRSARLSADLVADLRPELDRLLADFDLVADVLEGHELDLAESLAYSGDAVEGFASIALSGQEQVPWGDMFVTSVGAAGVDVVAGCGGLLDEQLDAVLGPDPRSCAEQDNSTQPDADADDDAGAQDASPGGLEQLFAPVLRGGAR